MQVQQHVREGNSGPEVTLSNNMCAELSDMLIQIISKPFKSIR